jgi:hypothetical protein
MLDVHLSHLNVVGEKRENFAFSGAKNYRPVLGESTGWRRRRYYAALASTFAKTGAVVAMQMVPAELDSVRRFLLVQFGAKSKY